MTTAVEIASNVASVVGVAPISTLVGNNTRHAAALRVLLNRATRALARKRGPFGEGWPVLTREHTIRTVVDIDLYVLPEDFFAVVPRTLWDLDSATEGIGPTTPRDWQEIRSGLVASVNTLAPRYRVTVNAARTGRALRFDPVPASVFEIRFEYISNHAWMSAEGARADRVQADTDETILDADVLELDLLWRFKQSRGLSYAAELGEFELERDRVFGGDSGERDIVIGRGRPRSPFNIPETGFGPQG